MMRAGDVETNPGPVMTRGQSQREESTTGKEEDARVGPPTEKARLDKGEEKMRTPVKVTREGKLPRRRVKTAKRKLSPPPTTSCDNPKCRKPFDGRSVIVTCEGCKKQFHKLCAGNRWRMDAVIQKKEKWRCESCKRNTTNQDATTNQDESTEGNQTPETTTPETSTPETTTPETEEGRQEEPSQSPGEETIPQVKLKCMHADCGKYLRARHGIFCTECNGGEHVQMKCSETRLTGIM
jgi:hypothetical protein